MFVFLLVSCNRNNTVLNITVTYNNGDVDTFYNVECDDSTIVLLEGDLIVGKSGVPKTIASGVRRYSLIK